MSDNKIFLSSSPHYTKGNNTQKIMAMVLISLLPECVFGVITFGIRALITIVVSVISAVAFEALFQKITKQKIIVNNLSAAVTGVLLALVVPSTTPVWMIILGAAVAVIIAKGLFGGIGSNVFNPALTGRAFLFLSFSSVMGASWFNPESGANKWSLAESSLNNIDAISSATMLSQIKNGTAYMDSDTILQYFIGNRAGCIGETSILLILISFIFLLVTRIIDFRAPLAMVATVVIATFTASFINLPMWDNAIQDVLMALLSGGLLFGATFMVTDYATTPVTKPGRWVFGAGCGLITFLIRYFGGYPEGVMFSILIMNSIAPFLNNLKPRMYGYGKRAHRHAKQDKIIQEFDLKNAKVEEVK